MRDLCTAPRTGRPSFLTEQAKQDIYEAALRICEDIGMRVHHERARALLVGAGCRAGDEATIRIPVRLIEQARSTAPASFLLHDRLAQPAMKVGGFNTYFGTGSDLMHTFDLESGERRLSVLEDVARAARLADALPNIDFVMSAAHPYDIDPHLAYLHEFTTMLEATTKPMVLTAENGRDLAAMIKIAQGLRGGESQLAAKPLFVVYNEPSSPLEHTSDAIEKLLLCAETGVPSIYSPAPLAGATAPITTAGHVALAVAEALFGLVIHQLHRPCAPFVYGMGPAVLDMATAQSSYNAPEYLVALMAAVEMAKWLDLPNWGYAGTTDAQLVDAQAGAEAGQLTLLSMMAGSNLNHDVGYLDFGLTGSLEQIVIVDELIALGRRLLQGMEVNEETLALDAIGAVGPGGHFLGLPHTRRHLRTAQWRPTILNRAGREQWLQEGSLDLRERARRKALQLLAEHQPAALAEDFRGWMAGQVARFTIGPDG